MFDESLQLVEIFWEEKGIKVIQGYVSLNQNSIREGKKTQYSLPIFFKHTFVVE